MSVDEQGAGPVSGRDSAQDTSLGLLVDEAERQLRICNACRYCEGLCAVFPALERRDILSGGDITQLANLCHDCRACFDACMYAPPHEFDLNLPKALAEVRVRDYRRYMWPRRGPRFLQGRFGVAIGIPVVTLILVAIALAHVGISGLVATPDGASSPYNLVPYPVLLAVVGVPAVFAIVVTAVGAWRFWADIGGRPSGMSAWAIGRAVIDSLTLRYLRGGGIGCNYPDDDNPSPVRRHLHSLVSGGFGLCVVSTASAAVLQDFAGVPPPYPLLSVPVVTGTLGGISMVAGCAALLGMKSRASRVTSAVPMVAKDYALLTALGFLALSGLATLLTRTTPAFSLVLLVHLVAIAFTFLAAPYGKFMHFVYRFLALLRNNLEAAGA